MCALAAVGRTFFSPVAVMKISMSSRAARIRFLCAFAVQHSPAMCDEACGAYEHDMKPLPACN